MKNQESNTSKATMITVRISPQVSGELEALARDTKRSKTHLAGEAIAEFVQRNALQIAQIRAALAKAESGAPGIPHEDMELWTNSWGTDHELPLPEPKA